MRNMQVLALDLQMTEVVNGCRCFVGYLTDDRA
jgi:hypothetical protein